MRDNLYTYHSNVMKKFLIGVAVFFVVMIVADVIFGKVMVYAESQSSSKNYHCMYEADEDILILGSSYAVRNIVPTVLEDSLGLSCYNAGEAGNGAMVAWVRYNMFIKKHTPKLIIYTLTPGYDYVDSDEYSKYLNIVKPYYGREETVNDMFATLMDKKECLILNSNFIKFNSYGAQLIYYWLTKKYIGLQGYQPLYETLTPYDDNKQPVAADYEVDHTKFAYIERLFADIKARNIPILCVLSPEYRKNVNLSQYKEGIELCKQYNIPLINHKYYEGISQNAEFFYDMSHLNDKGAKLYSAIISKEIEKVF